MTDSIEQLKKFTNIVDEIETKLDEADKIGRQDIESSIKLREELQARIIYIKKNREIFSNKMLRNASDLLELTKQNTNLMSHIIESEEKIKSEFVDKIGVVVKEHVKQLNELNNYKKALLESIESNNNEVSFYEEITLLLQERFLNPKTTETHQEDINQVIDGSDIILSSKDSK
jgi:hypothetical protein